MFRSGSRLHASTLGRWPLLGHLGWLRGAVGALLGIASAAGAGWLLFPHQEPAALPWLLAPVGASAVLAFAVPASPLAQPWPLIGGDLLSATVGVLVAGLLGPGPAAAAAAVCLAIAAMSLARCLHPPGGACALLAPLSAAHDFSAAAAFLPVLAANVVVLALVAYLYNGITGHPWPHRPVAVPPTPARSPVTRADLDAVLDEWDEVLDVDRDDLFALVQAVERRAAR